MALYHVHADVIVQGKHQGGAAGFARYIARVDRDQAAQYSRYLQRDGWSDEDLVAQGQGALPSWAKDATHFFEVADQHERRRGCVARTYEIALPRELSPNERLDLAADIRPTFFERYPHAWAIHNPIDPEGGEHPHMHLMLNERRVTDGVARGVDGYFRQPTGGGVRKDTAFHGPVRLRAIRAGIALLTNAALERAGVGTAVSHASLKARGETRAPAVYTQAKEKAVVEEEREALHAWDHPVEARLNLLQWRETKTVLGLNPLSREAMVASVHGTFWKAEHAHDAQVTEAGVGVEHDDRMRGDLAGEAVAQAQAEAETVWVGVQDLADAWELGRLGQQTVQETRSMAQEAWLAAQGEQQLRDAGSEAAEDAWRDGVLLWAEEQGARAVRAEGWEAVQDAWDAGEAGLAAEVEAHAVLERAQAWQSLEQDLLALTAQLDALAEAQGGRGHVRVRLWEREQGLGL